MSGTRVHNNEPATGKTQERRGVLESFNRALNGTLERVFEALGRVIGRRPVLVIVGSVLVALALGSGVHRIQNEERGEKLWVPSDNESQRNNAFVTKHFPSLARIEIFYLEREDGGNVLTPEGFNKALSIHNQVVSLQWNNTKSGGEGQEVDHLPAVQGLQDLCFSKEGTKGANDVLDCSMRNPLSIFNYNSSSWATISALRAILGNPTAWNQSLTGPGFVLEDVLGSISRDASGGVSGAKVLALSYLLAGNKTLVQEQKDDPAAEGWEQAYLDLMEEEDEADNVWHVRRLAFRSFDDEFGSTINGDLALLQVAIVLIILYTYLAISRPRDGAVGSRLLLTLGGIVNIGLAVLASYGFAAYLGLMFSPLMSILPFIMLGVGVDGMFVLQSALDATDPEHLLESRMAETMREGGISVTIASITNFFAFIIGSNTSLPALSAFSIYAALGLLFDLLLQITFFAAIMAIDQKRQENRKIDVLVCFTSTGKPEAGYCCGLIGARREEGYRVSAMKWLGKQYGKPAVKGIVLSMYVGLLGAGVYGTASMKVEADVTNFIPSNSYLVEWFDTLSTHFVSTGTDVSLYWINDAQDGPVDFSDPAVQTEMDSSLDIFRKNKYVVPETVSSWWEEMKAVNGTAPGTNFYPSLRQFLFSPTGARFMGDIAFVNEDPMQEIFAARSSFQWKYIEDTQEQIDAMVSMRDTTKLIPAPLGTRAFVHSADFLDIEQYKSIGKEVVMNIGLGFAMIAVVVLLLVANPIAACLTFLCVASAIVELVGFMYFRGTYIDSVSVIFLVISLGLAVDYSVHVAHGYLATREADPELRLQKTMVQTGVAVINGAVSTLIAALCLSGSASYVFVTFFFALLFIVVLGAVQGLVVLPVLLDIFRPAPHLPPVTQDEEAPK